MQTDHYKEFTNFHRMIGMVSDATKFTATFWYYLLRTAIFLDFIYSCIRSYKINKTNKLATKNNSTGSYAKVMDLKILPEPSNGLANKLSSIISTRLFIYAFNFR